MDSKKILLVLLLLSGALHFVGLNHPDSVVFDEVNFGSFIQSYCCSGEYFFDIHPPHAKLIIAAVSKVFGAARRDRFKNIGDPYEPGTAFGMRFAPAFVGSLVPLAVFILLGQLGASQSASFLGGLLFVFENALLLQTRIVALDGFLIFFTLTSLSVFLYGMTQPRPKKHLPAFAISGFLASLALATKFTGLVAIGIPAVIALVDLIKDFNIKKLRGWMSAGLCFLLAGVIIYLIGWYFHFALLTEPGPGDVWGRPSGVFFSDFLKLHQQMLSANAGLGAAHPDASPWWSWPWMSTPIYYWGKGNTWLYLVGNPVVWWGMTTLFIVAIISVMLSAISDLRILTMPAFSNKRLWIPLTGYCCSYIPMIAVSRVLFLYHYLTPLVFSTIFVVLWLEGIGAIRDGGILEQRWRYYAFIAVLIAGFIAVAPVTYGVCGDWVVKDTIFKAFPGWR